MTTSQNIVLIPAYEPGQSLLELLRDLSKQGCGHTCDTSIIVVDDGSGGDYRDIFEKVSQDAVVEKLKTIIDSEDPKAPYSDDRLSDLLRAEGFPVARRTVAKYRSMLNIPGMSARRIK